MITTFNDYIAAQMRNPHQKFEAIYNSQGKLEGVQAVGKFRQFAYATFNKAASDRVSRQLATALKQLRDEANHSFGKISGWGNIGHERLTFPVRTQDGSETVDIRERIQRLTRDQGSISDAQIERLHKIECSILLVERLAAGAIPEDTASLVSNESAMNDAIASGNTDHLFRMRTQAERDASKGEIGKSEIQTRIRFDKESHHLVVNSRLELLNKPKPKTIAPITFAETYDTVAAHEHNKAVGEVNYGQIHFSVFPGSAFPESTEEPEVSYATVNTPSPVRKADATPAADAAPVVDLIPTEDELEDSVAFVGNKPKEGETQGHFNARVEREVARLYKTGVLKRTPTPPADQPVTPAFVKDENATYAAVNKPASPTLPERTPESHVLKPATKPKPAPKPAVAPPLPPKEDVAPPPPPRTAPPAPKQRLATPPLPPKQNIIGPPVPQRRTAEERAQAKAQAGAKTYNKGDAVEFATVPSRGAGRRAEALAKLAGK